MLSAAMVSDAPVNESEANRKTGALLVVVAAVLWSTGGVGVKIADAEPLVIAGLRSAFALAFMIVVLALRLRRGGLGFGVVSALLERPLVWAAAASYALMVVMFVLAARRTTAANAIFIQYTAPVYVALLGGPLLGERVSARDGLAVGACVVGMALAFGGELGEGRMLGNVLAILSSFGFAGLPLLLRVDQKKLVVESPRLAAHAPLVATTLGNAIAAAVAIPAIAASPPAGPLAARTMLVIAGLGTLQIGLPYVLYSAAVPRLRALESSLLAMIEPVLSPIWVLLATGERPSPLAALGCGVIVMAVAAQAVKTRPRVAERSDE